MEVHQRCPHCGRPAFAPCLDDFGPRVEDPDAGRLRHFGLLDQSWTNLVFVDGRYSRWDGCRLRPCSRPTALTVAIGRLRPQPMDGRLPWVQAAPRPNHAGYDKRTRFTGLSTPPSSPKTSGFVRLCPAAGRSSQPVHLVFLTTVPGACVRAHRHTPGRSIVVEEGMPALTVAETYAGPSDEQYYCTNAVTEIVRGWTAPASNHHRLLAGRRQLLSTLVSDGSRCIRSTDSFFYRSHIPGLGREHDLGRNDFDASCLTVPAVDCLTSADYIVTAGRPARGQPALASITPSPTPPAD